MTPGADTPVVVVTGAAGGLGQALTAEFAAQGWRVAAAGRRLPALPSSPALWPLQWDVTDASNGPRVVEEILARWGRVDALVNNAGATLDQPLATLSPADWDAVLAVNLKGPFLCCQAVVPAMTRQGGGHILSIGSHSGRSGARGQANYAAAKAGLAGLTASLARELGPANIRVNLVLPGVLPTPMTARLPAARLQALARDNALQRLNSTDETARFIVFLAGMKNVSGQTFALDSRPAPWT